jgi:excisionase family DNA binding protein
MKKITTKEAARMMQISEQAVRMMIRIGRIPGASCGGTKLRRSYYITDEQVANLMKGV